MSSQLDREMNSAHHRRVPPSSMLRNVEVTSVDGIDGKTTERKRRRVPSASCISALGTADWLPESSA